MNCQNCGKTFKYGKYASEKEKTTGICHDCLNEPFNIASVCRLDLLDKFTSKEVVKMSDGNMQRLAEKLAGAYTDNCFWIDLEIIAESILEDK